MRFRKRFFTKFFFFTFCGFHQVLMTFRDFISFQIIRPVQPSQPTSIRLLDKSPNQATIQIEGPNDNVDYYHISYKPQNQYGTLQVSYLCCC